MLVLQYHGVTLVADPFRVSCRLGMPRGTRRRVFLPRPSTVASVA